LAQVNDFEPQSLLNPSFTGKLDALEISIYEGLSKTFGEDSPDYERYRLAATFDRGDASLGTFSLWAAVQKSKDRSIALLEQAIFYLQEGLQDAYEDEENQADMPPLKMVAEKSGPHTRKIFIVHGHDGESREAVARFLQSIDFDPIILHERPNLGRTIIEKFEANSDVGFAVVLLTPDDFGRTKLELDEQSRARQNVILELGYFVGRLGRHKVCALKKGTIEIPTDYLGVVYTDLDENGGWKLKLGQELQAAGYEIEWNNIMGKT
jgi:predicted nucleotide-binding protein